MGGKVKSAKGTRRGLNAIEPKKLDLAKLAREKHGCKWSEVKTSEQVKLLREELRPSTVLFDADTPWMWKWDVTVLTALLFTTVVTPYEVALLRTSVNALFIVNRVVDGIFVFDMILQFFLKVTLETPNGQIQVRDRRKIAAWYLRGWFIIDLISIFPVDIMSVTMSSTDLSKLKILRVLRLMRLVKMVRVLRASRIVQRWVNYVSVTFATLAVIKFCMLLLVWSHWGACIWSLIGDVMQDNLDCIDPERPLWRYNPEGESWISAHFRPKMLEQRSPDNPCNPSTIYLVALHFSVMTITSVGYGDVVPVQLEEYLVCIFVMLCSGVVYAYVIGSGCSVISNMDPVTAQFEQRMDALNGMAAEQKLRHPLRYRLREFVRESKNHEAYERSRGLLELFSPQIKSIVCQELSKRWVTSVWYFASASDLFIVALTTKMHNALFERREEARLLQAKLCVVRRGSMARSGKVYLAGTPLGVEMIIADQKLLPSRIIMSLSYSEVASIAKDELDVILEEFPEERLAVHRAAMKLTLLHLVLRVFHEEKAGQLTEVGLRYQRLLAAAKKLGDLHDGHDAKTKGKAKLVDASAEIPRAPVSYPDLTPEQQHSVPHMLQHCRKLLDFLSAEVTHVRSGVTELQNKAIEQMGIGAGRIKAPVHPSAELLLHTIQVAKELDAQIEVLHRQKPKPAQTNPFLQDGMGLCGVTRDPSLQNGVDHVRVDAG
mmetsp:Transcript_16121/g.41049  ORF Transcript_16121/g.41049 Transcript_16121/m.41049 type:complete len:716 (-) Transcript_16121:262-2409(-)